MPPKTRVTRGAAAAAFRGIDRDAERALYRSQADEAASGRGDYKALTDPCQFAAARDDSMSKAEFLTMAHLQALQSGGALDALLERVPRLFPTRGGGWTADAGADDVGISQSLHDVIEGRAAPDTFRAMAARLPGFERVDAGADRRREVVRWMNRAGRGDATALIPSTASAGGLLLRELVCTADVRACARAAAAGSVLGCARNAAPRGGAALKAPVLWATGVVYRSPRAAPAHIMLVAEPGFGRTLSEAVGAAPAPSAAGRLDTAFRAGLRKALTAVFKTLAAVQSGADCFVLNNLTGASVTMAKHGWGDLAIRDLSEASVDSPPAPAALRAVDPVTLLASLLSSDAYGYIESLIGRKAAAELQTLTQDGADVAELAAELRAGTAFAGIADAEFFAAAALADGLRRDVLGSSQESNDDEDEDEDGDSDASGDDAETATGFDCSKPPEWPSGTSPAAKRALGLARKRVLELLETEANNEAHRVCVADTVIDMNGEPCTVTASGDKKPACDSGFVVVYADDLKASTRDPSRRDKVVQYHRVRMGSDSDSDSTCTKTRRVQDRGASTDLVARRALLVQLRERKKNQRFRRVLVPIPISFNENSPTKGFRQLKQTEYNRAQERETGDPDAVDLRAARDAFNKLYRALARPYQGEAQKGFKLTNPEPFLAHAVALIELADRDPSGAELLAELCEELGWKQAVTEVEVRSGVEYLRGRCADGTQWPGLSAVCGRLDAERKRDGDKLAFGLIGRHRDEMSTTAKQKAVKRLSKQFGTVCKPTVHGERRELTEEEALNTVLTQMHLKWASDQWERFATAEVGDADRLKRAWDDGDYTEATLVDRFGARFDAWVQFTRTESAERNGRPRAVTYARDTVRAVSARTQQPTTKSRELRKATDVAKQADKAASNGTWRFGGMPIRAYVGRFRTNERRKYYRGRGAGGAKTVRDRVFVAMSQLYQALKSGRKLRIVTPVDGRGQCRPAALERFGIPGSSEEFQQYLWQRIHLEVALSMYRQEAAGEAGRERTVRTLRGYIDRELACQRDHSAITGDPRRVARSPGGTRRVATAIVRTYERVWSGAALPTYGWWFWTPLFAGALNGAEESVHVEAPLDVRPYIRGARWSAWEDVVRDRLVKRGNLRKAFHTFADIDSHVRSPLRGAFMLTRAAIVKLAALLEPPSAVGDGFGAVFAEMCRYQRLRDVRLGGPTRFAPPRDIVRGAVVDLARTATDAISSGRTDALRRTDRVLTPSSAGGPQVRFESAVPGEGAARLYYSASLDLIEVGEGSAGTRRATRKEKSTDRDRKRLNYLEVGLQEAHLLLWHRQCQRGLVVFADTGDDTLQGLRAATARRAALYGELTNARACTAPAYSLQRYNPEADATEAERAVLRQLRDITREACSTAVGSCQGATCPPWSDQALAELLLRVLRMRTASQMTAATWSALRTGDSATIRGLANTNAAVKQLVRAVTAFRKGLLQALDKGAWVAGKPRVRGRPLAKPSNPASAADVVGPPELPPPLLCYGQRVVVPLKLRAKPKDLAVATEYLHVGSEQLTGPYETKDRRQQSVPLRLEPLLRRVDGKVRYLDTGREVDLSKPIHVYCEFVS